jgi:large subunit ribosomal protein L4
MKLDVLNKEGKDTGRKASFSKTVFGIEPNDHAIYLDAKQYLASQRQGTHKSKDKSEIMGSTKKLRKQKGSGAARIGSVKSGILRGGGRFHGPKPRDYWFKLNKKVKRIARMSALTYKAQEKNITVIEGFDMDAPNTKSFAQVLANLKVDTKRTLFVVPTHNENLYLSCRNIAKAEVLEASNLNTYSILKASNLVLVEESISKIEEILSK